MSEYGWQIYGENGDLIYDDSIVMSKWLGSYEIPIMANKGSSWIKRISGIAFRDGTPFAYCVATPDIVFSENSIYSYSPPNIYCGSDYIDIS